MKEMPLVSIVMATYNRADFIDEAIVSVLNQTYSNWELLVLDDASTDNTSSIVKTYQGQDKRIKYFPAEKNQGITKNRNRAFNLAIGEYMAVLDSDDMWSANDKLEKQIDFLEKNKDYVLVGTQVEVIDEQDKKISEFKYKTKDAEIRKNLLLRNQFTHSSIVWRRSADSDITYDQSLPIWEDYELILRMGLTGKLFNLDQIMTSYRKHSQSISAKNKSLGVKVHLDIIKRYKNSYPNYTLSWLKGLFRKFV